jgi:hypothetical protein
MLRTDLFKTMDRAETRFIAVRDTLTKADPELDIRHFDQTHCRRGRLGVGWHFLILVSGDIQLGRYINTCGAHSKNLDEVSVAIGIVGGKDDERKLNYTRNPEQEEALADLIEVLKGIYPMAEVNDSPVGVTALP